MYNNYIYSMAAKSKLSIFHMACMIPVLYNVLTNAQMLTLRWYCVFYTRLVASKWKNSPHKKDIFMLCFHVL